MAQTTKCVVCDQELKMHEEKSRPEKLEHWGMLSGGIICRSRGNYGSTLYDPMDVDEYIEFYLCDECIKSNAKKIRRAVVGVRSEGMDEYFAKEKAIRDQYDKFDKFKKTVCGDARLSTMESRVLWFLQGLKKGFDVKYNFDKAVQERKFACFGIPAIRVLIIVWGNTQDLLGHDDMVPKLAEIEEITNAMREGGYRTMTLLPNDLFLRNKGLGRCFKSLREPVRNRIIELVGPSNYDDVPGLEPAEDD